jgi:hypothetical protein
MGNVEKKCIPMALKSAIDGYLGDNPNINLNIIAKRSPLAYNTLKSIQRGEAKSIQRKTVFQVLAALNKNRPLYAWKSEYGDGPLGPYIDEIVKKSANEKARPVNETISKAYTLNPIVSAIMISATTDQGISIDEIQENFGNFGLNETNKLVSDGIIEVHDGVARVSDAKNDEYTSLFQEDLKLVSSNLIREIYRDDLYYKGDENWLSLQAQSINTEGHKKIIQLFRGLFNDVQRIMDDKSNKSGNCFPVFFTMGYDKILRGKDVSNSK